MKSTLATLLACPLLAQVIVPTYHNDNARTGLNPLEALLTPASVGSGHFGKRYTRRVDGNIYAQPLYLPAVPISGKGAHNVVLVATAHDSVYAFDADSNLGANAKPLWQVSFLDPANGISPVPAADIGCNVISPEIGIIGTPVVDPGSLIVYVIAETKEPGPSYVYRLHAIDIKTGLELNNSPVRIQPQGFNPTVQKHRTALLLANGRVYSTWSGICDQGEYQGWVMSHDAKTLELRQAFNDSPGSRGGSFWNGGSGAAADASGNIYAVTANGPFDIDTGGLDYGDSFLKLSAELSALDYFAPFNRDYLNGNDIDLGSTGAVLLPDEAGTPEHPHLIAGAGKEGRIYLLDRDHMGKAQTGNDAGALASLPAFDHSLFGSLAYFDGRLYAVPEYLPLTAFSVANAKLASTPLSHAPVPADELGATPSVSSSGKANGVVWIVPFNSGGALEAYDAADVSRQLYTSAANPADALGGWSEFAVPTVADGKVFVGTANNLVVYGILNADPGHVTAAVNAASFQAGPVAAGSLISIFGSGLAMATASASTQPLPISIADVGVQVNGVPAPLLYVSPLQINAQVPPETPAGTASVIVTVAGVSTAALSMQVQPAAPGIFTRSTGEAAAVDTSGQAITADHPAASGSVISVFLTGLGITNLPVTTTIAAIPATVQFSGPAPGYVGLGQVNVLVPDVPSGVQAINVVVNGVPSNTASVAISGR